MFIVIKVAIGVTMAVSCLQPYRVKIKKHFYGRRAEPSSGVKMMHRAYDVTPSGHSNFYNIGYWSVVIRGWNVQSNCSNLCQPFPLCRQ